ncbi:MAG: response regulator transcription factor [Clostridiales bacterium]|nr:response regulator transcription factor [Clostridiales bacterium]
MASFDQETGHKRPLVFLVEDDRDMAQLNARFLMREGWDTLIAYSVKEARNHVEEVTPDLFVFDILLPDGNGLTLCEEFRQITDAPVIFLTSRKELDERLAGFDAGCDYYLTKPYSMDEFVAVAQTLLRRARQTKEKIDKAVEESSSIIRGSLTLNVKHNKAYIGMHEVPFTPKEWAILLLLVQNEGETLHAGRIFQRVWGTAPANDSGVLRQHISRVNKKLNEASGGEFAILNDYGGNYSFYYNHSL